MTPLTQEIRLATTLTGGVSLAIWMGGVAREIDLLTQASNLRRLDDAAQLTLADSDPRRRYLDLLNLLDVTVDVDVLSGSSGGGINAALLAYGRAAKRDLGKLRDLWLEMGALETLLRNPADTEFPSLLQGDAEMYANLQRALPKLPMVTNPSANTVSTTLFITTTLLTGEASRFTDTYGTLVQDVDHRGVFRFTQHTLSQTDALALAARSSASFPGAFEPSYLPYADPVPAAGPVPARPPVGALANITRNHWAADGGLLDNQPIDAVLRTVFQRPARRQARRVLLYVVPTAGPDPEPATAGLPADDIGRPYTMIDGLLKDLGAVLTQSIAADLRAIREHNERVGVRTDMRQRLAQLAVECRIGQGPDDLLLTDGLFADYRSRAADRLAGQLVPELLRLLGSWPRTDAGTPVDPRRPTLPERWGAVLLPGSTVEQDCRRSVQSVIAERWPDKPTDLAGLAGFGQDAFHGAKTIALSMLRCRFLLAGWDDPRSSEQSTEMLVRLLTALHAAFQPAEHVDVEAFVQAQAQRSDIQALALPEAVGELARRYLDLMDQPAAGPAEAAAGQPSASSDPEAAGLLSAWRQVAAIVAELIADPLVTAVPACPAAAIGSRAEQVSAAAERLRTYAEYLRGAADDQARALRLFALHAAHRAMLPTDAEVDQPVELIQLSSDTRTLLDLGRATAASKLTGLQLDHFGAFLKRSWRANDWMWGRLDGAGWLIHLLLDPRRINTIAIVKDGSRITGFLSQLAELGIPEPPAGRGIAVSPATDGAQRLLNADTIKAELAFLDDATAPVPVSLPLTALWVARGRQQQVAGEELPVLAQTILDPSQRESASTAARSWANSVQQAAPADRERDAAALLASCPVPDERLRSELGTPLMMRTAAKAAAVTAAAVRAMPQVPAPIRPLASVLRTVTLAGYRVTDLVNAWPRRMILAGLALLLIGALVATGQSTVFGLTGVLIAAVGGYLLVFGAWQTSRAVLGAVLSATVIGAAASLTVPVVRRGLFGVRGGEAGWLNGRVLWLGEQWWHPMAGLGAALLTLTLIGIVFTRRGSSRSPGFRLPRAVSMLGAVLTMLVVLAALAIALSIKGS
ncbi:MAG: patatin-like protein [Jatrophihabitantaceae bacterium]